MKKLIFLGLTLVLVFGLILIGCSSATTVTKTTQTTQATTVTTTAKTTVTSTTTKQITTKVLRLAHPLPPFDQNVLSCIQAADEFNAAAGGAYKIEVYPGGVLAGMLEGFDLVRQGAIEISDFSPDFLAEKDLVYGPQSIPFVFKDFFAEAKFLQIIREKIWQKRIEENYGVKVIFLSGLFAHDGWCGTKPIKTLNDWKGKVVWVAGPAEAEAIKLLGASPVTMDWGEGYPAMEKGVVDGGTYGLGAAWMSNWTACKYFTVANMFSSTGCLVMNLDLFNEMPADIQQALLKAMKAHEDRMYQFMGYDAPAQSEAALTGPEWGAEIYHVPDAEVAKWKEATTSVAENYFSKLDPADAQIIKDAIAEANK
jgi:TRAP-type transport system periplasmic protein